MAHGMSLQRALYEAPEPLSRTELLHDLREVKSEVLSCEGPKDLNIWGYP